MLDLILAMLCSTLVSVVMRVGSGSAEPRKPMLAANYLVCFAVSLLFLKPGAGRDGLGFAAGLGLIGGVLYLSAFLLFQRSIHDNGVTLSSVFMKLGVVVPTVLGFTLFRERVSFMRVAGIALTAAAIVILSGRPSLQHLRESG